MEPKLHLSKSVWRKQPDNSIGVSCESISESAHEALLSPAGMLSSNVERKRLVPVKFVSYTKLEKAATPVVGNTIQKFSGTMSEELAHMSHFDLGSYVSNKSSTKTLVGLDSVGSELGGEEENRVHLEEGRTEVKFFAIIENDNLYTPLTRRHCVNFMIHLSDMRRDLNMVVERLGQRRQQLDSTVKELAAQKRDS